MNKEEIVEFLEERLAKYKKEEPYAVNIHMAYETVINDILMEE